DPELNVIFFGDNSQFDAKVYYDLTNEMNLKSKIYVRDVSTEATYFSADLPVVRLPNVVYFFSEMDLTVHSDFIFISAGLKNLITKGYQNKSLIPAYTLDTLEERLEDICKKESKSLTDNGADKSKCKEEAKSRASKFWSDYYGRM
ncbi:MAG: hypothetical protein K2Q18_07495, partial [Bdellovibrionales bacterium]|nr:hypothetical protein [Bdellovibrionales bacterium]